MTNVLVAVICCSFKEDTLDDCLQSIQDAGFSEVLLNFEGIAGKEYNAKYLQEWIATGEGYNDERKFDQNQDYRLGRICIARNMCLDFAKKGNYDWILFVDSDVLIPKNTLDINTGIFQEFAVSAKIRGGLVYGRGVHSMAKYIGYPHEMLGEWQRVDYATCGFMAIHESVYNRLSFRYGKSLISETICSEDPLAGEFARLVLKEDWWVKLNLVAKHIGDLKEGETSQF